MRVPRVLPLAYVAAAIAGCGGGSSGGGGGGGTQPPVPVASVTLSPSSAQSINACGTVSFTAQARDAQNNVLSGRPIDWESSDASKVVLSIGSGAQTTATGIGVGSSTITARSGTVTSNPGVAVTVTAGGASGSAAVGTTETAFTPTCVTITAGGTVTWNFTTTHNVTFTTANAPPGGNVPDQGSGNATRTFPNVGNYPYTCTLHQGMNGRVVVQ
ncbi:MAG: plastocyanin/azurin family copper-binding protein [Gemmatimonadaceae bacterium]